MPYVDPLKVTRNPETLQAYRQHRRALLAAAQPWLTIALVTLALALGLLGYALSHDGFLRLSVVYGVLMLAYGLCIGVASVRAWRYQRAHPLVLPEPPSVWSQPRDLG